METLLPIIAIALIFWLLIIRPAQRRQKEAVRVQNAAGPGAQVMLTSGIFGTITEAEPDAATVLVEVAPGVTVKVVRGAIGSVVTPEEDNELADPKEATTSEGLEETTPTSSTDHEER